MKQNLPEFINTLTTEDLKKFFDAIGFEDYDFSKNNNQIELRFLEKNKVHEYTLTDYYARGENINVANALSKRFSEFLEDTFGSIYTTAKTQYFENLLKDSKSL